MLILFLCLLLLGLILQSHAFLSSPTFRGITKKSGLTHIHPTLTRKSSLKRSNDNNDFGEDKTAAPDDAYDVVVVGSGIGGLSSAAILAKYGYSVLVLESHTEPGGAAHGFSIRVPKIGDFLFDTGPSFFSGLNPDLPAKQSNPLRTILDYIEEPLACEPYESFGLVLPEGRDLIHTCQFGRPGGLLDEILGAKGLTQWNRVMELMDPLAAAVDALPTAAIRTDVGAPFTVGPYLKNFASLNPLNNLKLTKPFQSILDDAEIPKDGFVQRWLDLLCFCLSGLPASGTVTAEMALMMGEFYNDGAIMDCPRGGAKSIVKALVRGIEKNGGTVQTNSHVKKIVVKDGRAVGVELRGKSSRPYRAKKAVVSNVSVWDLFDSKKGLINPSDIDDSFRQSKITTPVAKSFMHLHLGFRASREELEQLQAHYMYMDDWDRGVDAEDNAALLSIPSVHDTSVAPDGYGVLHIYTPATEEYTRWEGLDRRSSEYKALKEERSEYLWKVLEKILPFDIRERTVTSRVGTPLTHQRFLNRHRGSYGPATTQGLPFPTTPIKGLLVCGDSCFPGIGVPAVAGSGLLTAHSVSLDSVKPQMELLENLRRSTD